MMSNFNGYDFEKLKQDLEKIEVPKEKMKAARQQAYTRHLDSRKRQIKTWKQVSIVMLLLIAFVATVRVSPAFAQTIAKIPGFAPLVEMITQDKGVKDILDNQYYEELNIVEIKNNLTLTILGTIADESGMIIFYQLEAPYDISELGTKKFRLTQNAKDIEAATSYSWAAKEPTKIIEEKLEIVATNKIDYSNPNFQLELTFDDANNTSFTVPFTLKKEIVPTKTYEINQQLEIDSQIIHIKSLKISPLRAEVQITADDQNTMQILQINKLKVLDENGEEWGKITNGFSGFGGFRENDNSIFIQSNYFREPQSLTLVIDEVEALPKGEDYIEIDFLKQEILKIPPLKDFELSLRDFDMFDVSYKSPQNDHKQLLSTVIDANGNKFYSDGHSFRYRENGTTVEATYSFDLKGAVNPVRVYFNSYPNFLEGSAEINISLDDKSDSSQ